MTEVRLRYGAATSRVATRTNGCDSAAVMADRTVNDGPVGALIRPATAADADDMARIWFEAWGDGHRGNVPDELLRHRSREHFGRRAAQRVPHSWIGEVDGRPVGFVTVEGDEIEQLFVDAAARGTGVAALLLRHGHQVIREKGHRSAWLAVVAGNARARAFYEKLGWRDDGPFDYQAQTEEGPIDVPCRRYVIDLSAPADD